MAKAFFIALTMAVVFQGLFTYATASRGHEIWIQIRIFTWCDNTTEDPMSPAYQDLDKNLTDNLFTVYQAIPPMSISLVNFTCKNDSIVEAIVNVTFCIGLTANEIESINGTLVNEISDGYLGDLPVDNSTLILEFHVVVYVPATGDGPEIWIWIYIITPCDSTTEDSTSQAYKDLECNLTANLFTLYQSVQLKSISVANFTCKDNSSVKAIVNVTFGAGIPANVSVNGTLISEISDGNLGDLPVNHTTVVIVFHDVAQISSSTASLSTSSATATTSTTQLANSATPTTSTTQLANSATPTTSTTQLANSATPTTSTTQLANSATPTTSTAQLANSATPTTSTTQLANSATPTTSTTQLANSATPTTSTTQLANSATPTTSTTQLANSATPLANSATPNTNTTATSTSTIFSPPPPPTTTSIISPTTSTTPPPTSATFTPATGDGPEVRINLTITNECSAMIENLTHPQSEFLSNMIMANFTIAYKNYQLKAVVIISFTCRDSFTKTEAMLTVTFGTGISAGVSIKAILVAYLKNISVEATVEIEFQGITISSTAKGDECQKKCCDGAGGAITVERVCTPTDKCEGRDKDPDKTEDGHCDAGGLCQAEAEKCDGSSSSPSLVVIVLLAFATFVGAMI